MDADMHDATSGRPLPRLGVGVIGTGFMGRCHALAFRTAPMLFPLPLTVDLAMVADIDVGAAEQAATRYGFARWTGDWRALIDDPAVDLVAITAPNARHAEMALAALAAGKHVYCEKPMAPVLDDALAMADAAARAGTVTLVGYNYLVQPAMVFARRLIEEGAIGAASHFRAVNDEDYMADPAVAHSWRCRRAESGTGALGDLGSHAIAMALHLVGPIAAVSAARRTVVPARPLPGGGTAAVENEDLADVLVRFADGTAGTIATSRVSWGRKNRLACEVVGTGGALAFDQERMNELQLYQAGGAADRNGFRTIAMGPAHPPYGAFVPAPGHQLGFNDMKVIEVARLVESIAGGRSAGLDFAAAVAVERVLAAVVRSAETGAWAEIAAF